MPRPPAPPEPNAEDDVVTHDDAITHDGPGTNPSIGLGEQGGGHQLPHITLGSEVKFRRVLDISS